MMEIQQRGCLVNSWNEKTVFCIYIARINADITQRTANIIWNYVIRSCVVIYAYIAHKSKCSNASSCMFIMVCHINMILFFSVIAPFPPHPKKIVSMTQASFPPFQIPRENSTLYGDIPNTPNVACDHLSMPGSSSPESRHYVSIGEPRVYLVCILRQFSTLVCPKLVICYPLSSYILEPWKP